MIYSQQQRDSIIYQSQVWLADLGIKLEALERSMEPCEELYCKGYRVRLIISAIQKNFGITEQELESLYTALVRITSIKDYPVTVPITGEPIPSIVIGKQGPVGPVGASGIDGTSANIRVESDDDEIKITSAPDPLDNTIEVYKIKHDPYIIPKVTLGVDIPLSIEIGEVKTVTLSIDLIKGRDDVTASTILPASLTTAYNNIPLDLDGLNVGGPSGRILVVTGLNTTITYTVDIADEGVPVVKDTASKTINFIYPFLHGNTIADAVDPYTLTKLLQLKGTKIIDFDGVSKYFWFCYPATYGVLSSIKDQNGFEVFAVTNPAFIKIDQDVVSTGLTNNWAPPVPYYLYRTKAVTDINGEYTFKF